MQRNVIYMGPGSLVMQIFHHLQPQCTLVVIYEVLQLTIHDEIQHALSNAVPFSTEGCPE